MKKQFALALATMMLFSAVKGMAADDGEYSRISASELMQINQMISEISDITRDIGNSTTDDSHIMTGVGQLEEEALRLQAEANKSMDENVIDQNYGEVSKIKERLTQIRSGK